jgi:IS1 family transposase
VIAYYAHYPSGVNECNGDKNVRVDDSEELGNAWVFVALDAQTKLIPSYIVGKRDRATTYKFLSDLRDRLAEEHRFQITTDGFVFYRNGVEEVFAGQADSRRS